MTRQQLGACRRSLSVAEDAVEATAFAGCRQLVAIRPLLVVVVPRARISSSQQQQHTMSVLSEILSFGLGMPLPRLISWVQWGCRNVIIGNSGELDESQTSNAGYALMNW